MHRTPHPDARPAGPSPLRRALTLIGRIAAAVAVVAAGVAGWFGVQQFVLADDGAGSALGAVGDGLPTQRLDPPDPWRRFEVTLQSTGREHRVALDLDAQEMRFRVLGPETLYEFVARADLGHDRADGDWVALTPDETAAQSKLFAQKVGPYLVTDIVPPAALPHTTVLSDVAVGDLRVFDVSIDASSFRLADPLGHERWLVASGEVADGPARRTIHVRPDGYIVRIDRTGSTRIWTELTGPLFSGSPLAQQATIGTTEPPTTG